MIYFLSLILFLTPSYLIRFQIFGLPTNLVEILILPAFVIWLAFRQPKNFPSLKYWWPVFLFIISAVISVLVAPDKLSALGILKGWIIVPILFGLVLFSEIQRRDREQNLKILSYGLVLGALLVALQAIWQKIAGVTAVDGRVLGIYGLAPLENASPNYLALYLAPVTVLSFAWLFLNKAVHKWFCLLTALILILAIYFSGSRGGILAVFAGVLAIGFWLLEEKYPQAKKILKVSLLAVIFVTIFALWQIAKPDFQAPGGRATSSNNIRWEIWKTSLQMVAKQPFVGIGLGNFQNYFTNYTQNKVNFPQFIAPNAYSPHNLYLAIWLNLGLLGLFSFVWLMFLFFKASSSLPLLAAMISILVYGVVDTPYFKNDLSVIFWMLFFLQISFMKASGPASGSERGPKGPEGGR